MFSEWRVTENSPTLTDRSGAELSVTKRHQDCASNSVFKKTLKVSKDNDTPILFHCDIYIQINIVLYHTVMENIEFFFSFCV